MQKNNLPFIQFFLLVLIPSLLSAQDSLFFKNKNVLAVSIEEIDETVIKYKKFDNLSGPAYVVNQTDVSYIIYKSGNRLNVDSLINSYGKKMAKRAPEGEAGNAQEDMYFKGRNDAKRFYQHPGGRGCAAVSGGCLGVFGLIPTILIATTPPKERNLGYPNSNLWKNEKYRAGYEDTAERMKNRKVWMAYGQGLLVWVALYAGVFVMAYAVQ